MQAAPLPAMGSAGRKETCSAHHVPPRYFSPLPPAQNPYVDPASLARRPTVCIVRDPLERWVSEYNYRNRHGNVQDLVDYTRRAVGALASEVENASVGDRRLDAPPLWGPPPEVDARYIPTDDDDDDDDDDDALRGLMRREVARATAAEPFAPTEFFDAKDRSKRLTARLPEALSGASIVAETTGDCHLIPQYVFVYYDNRGNNASCDRVISLQKLDEAICEIQSSCVPRLVFRQRGHTEPLGRERPCVHPSHRNPRPPGQPTVGDLPRDLADALRVLYAPDYFFFGHLFRETASWANATVALSAAST